ncbi:hypothetical protein FSB08_16250 [Paraburkholderia sp. JPY432]|uniref:hypothetical protein n=1 Tax=Paraburkholderia youngii TaxID=2782701 RepID=UPI0015958A7F|nr:hypothetical protein [Paraburkholderia youngii]NVH74080.1 hypothetical protein [Paraburkholderia youngii]
MNWTRIAAGAIAQIEGRAIGTIAREAGAPVCKGAGVDLLCGIGQSFHQLSEIGELRLGALDSMVSVRAALRTGGGERDRPRRPIRRRNFDLLKQSRYIAPLLFYFFLTTSRSS